MTFSAELENLAGYLHTAEYKNAPLLASGSWMRWLMNDLKTMLPRRFQYHYMENLPEDRLLQEGRLRQLNPTFPLPWWFWTNPARQTARSWTTSAEALVFIPSKRMSHILVADLTESVIEKLYIAIADDIRHAELPEIEKRDTSEIRMKMLDAQTVTDVADRVIKLEYGQLVPKPPSVDI